MIRESVRLIAASFFATANYVEALLWATVALLFAASAMRRHGAVRKRCVLAAVTFLLFGISDVVEVQTGAWWRPWWLLLWKAVCLLCLLGLLINHRRGRTRADGPPA